MADAWRYCSMPRFQSAFVDHCSILLPLDFPCYNVRDAEGVRHDGQCRTNAEGRRENAAIDHKHIGLAEQAAVGIDGGVFGSDSKAQGAALMGNVFLRRKRFGKAE